MSSLYVRDIVRGWLSDAAAPVKFYDTENFEQKPSDEIWSTVEWGIGFNQKLNFCDDLMETSEFNVVVSGPMGEGDSNVLAAAESLTDYLMAQKDPAGKCLLTMNAAPETFNSSLNYFCVSVAIEYEYQR